MVDNVRQSLRNVERLLNLYVVTLGLLLLAMLIADLNRPASPVDGRQAFDIFGLTIYPEYLSLISGILFGIFIVVLFLQVRLLRGAVLRASHGKRDEFVAVADLVWNYPWITSPFHALKTGTYLFWGIVFAGFCFIATIALSHILGIKQPDAEIMDEWIYRAIGYFDAVVIIISAALVRSIAASISSTRACLDACADKPAEETPDDQRHPDLDA